MKIGNGHVIIRLVLAFLLAAPAPAFSAVINGELKKARLENLSADPTGTNGKVYFNTTTTKGRIYNGTAWTDIGSGSGGGGFTDQITNGNAEDTLVPTAWSTYNDGAAAAPVDGTGGTASQITAIARDTTAGNLINGTAVWKMAKSAANAQGMGWSYAFTPPANWSGRNSLVSLTFNYFMSTASGDDIRVYLYDVTNSTLITPSFVTCGGGTAPKLTATTSVCQAKLAWVSSGATSYRLVFHVATTLTTAMNVFMDDISITDYRAQPGQNLEAWKAVSAYTMFTNAGITSPTTNALESRREGDSVHFRGVWGGGSAVSGTANGVTFNLPAGLTINTAALASTSGRDIFGTAWWNTAGSVYTALAPYYGTSTTIIFRKQGGGQLIESDLSTGAEFRFDFTVPVNEYAGGTSFGENQVEYAYNTSGTTTAGASDTTSFAYGPTGAAIGSIASTTGSSSVTTMRVRFQSPIQSTDEIVVQVSQDGVTWHDLPNVDVISSNVMGASWYGISTRNNTTTLTDVDVQFGNKGRQASNATYAGDGSTWAGVSTWKWRVKRFRGGVVVPFGLATSTTPGLVKDVKEYLAGTAYTNGTPALSGTGWATTRGALVPYQTTDGAWRMRFNIRGTGTSAAAYTLTLSGVTFKTGYDQAVSVVNPTAGTWFIGDADGGAGTFRLASGAAGTGWSLSGDVELDSKPTWAD